MSEKELDVQKMTQEVMVAFKTIAERNNIATDPLWLTKTLNVLCNIIYFHLDMLENTYIQAVANGDAGEVKTKTMLWNLMKETIDASIKEAIERAGTEALTH